MTAFLAGLAVGLVGPVAPPAGGMAMQTQQLSELLATSGARVTVVPTNPPYWPGAVEKWRGVRAVFRLCQFVASIWRACPACDVVHVMANSGWSWHLMAAPAVWIAWLRGVPVIVNYRGGEAESFLHRSALLIRFTLKRTSGLMVPSRFLERIFAVHHISAKIIPNIIDTVRFHPADAAEKALLQIIVARNLELVYDNATALRAFKRVLAFYPNARLILAGAGPEENRLKALSNELGLVDQVHFAGRVSREAMAHLLRASTVALNPSMVDNMPNSLLEALASGVPVVSTKVGGVPFMVVDGETALLVPPRDPEAMAAAILRLLDQSELYVKLVDAGLREANKYTWLQVEPRLGAFYESAITGKRVVC